MKPLEDVAIFWDIENCPVPATSDGYAAANSIISLARPFGRIRLFRAYLEIAGQLLLRSELQSSGVSLIDCPRNGRKDVADKMMIVDMLTYAIDNPTPCTILVISGDRDFAYALSMLKIRHYQMVLVTLPNAHRSLTAQACVRFNWSTTVSNSTIRSSTILSQAGTLNPSGYNHISAASREASSYHNSIPPPMRKAYQTGSIFRPEADETSDITQTLLGQSRRPLSSSYRPFQSHTDRGVKHHGQGNANLLSAADITTSKFIATSYAHPCREASVEVRDTVVGDIVTRPGLPAVLEQSISPPAPAAAKRGPSIDSDAIPTSLVLTEPDTANINHAHKVEENHLEETTLIDCVAVGSALPTATPTEGPAAVPFAVSIETSPPVTLPSADADYYTDAPLQTLAVSLIGNGQDDDVEIQGAQKPEVPIAPKDNGPTCLNNAAAEVSTTVVSPPTPRCQTFTSSASDTSTERPDAETETTWNTPYSLNNPLDSWGISLTFEMLIETLHRLRNGGLLRPLRSTIVLLISPHDDGHETIALTEAIEAALAKGVIVSGGEEPQSWIGLPAQVYDTASSLIFPRVIKMPPSKIPEANIGSPTFDDEPCFEMLTSQSGPSSSEQATSIMQRQIPSHFVILVQTLQAHRNNGEHKPLRTEVALQIADGGKTYERAGVTNLRKYLRLAEKEGFVKTGGTDLDKWICLQPEWCNVIPMRGPQMQEVAPSEFGRLVQRLQAFRDEGNLRPRQSQVKSQLSKGTYRKAGVSKFGPYIDRAVNQGIIEVGESDGQAWISLQPKWHYAAVL